MYLIAALLEGGGIWTIVADVRAQRARAAELLKRPRRTRIPMPSVMGTGWIQHSVENDQIRRGAAEAGAILTRRASTGEAMARRVAAGAAKAEMELVDELVKILGGSLFRKLLGPALLILGVLAGTAANIGNT